MQKLFAVAACAGMLFQGSATCASAGTPWAGSCVTHHCVTVGVAHEGQRVIVTIKGTASTSWAYNPAHGSINQMREPSAYSVPIKGTVVKGGKNPGGNYVNMIVDANGTAQFPATMAAGNYGLVVTVPAHAINSNGAGARNGRMASVHSSSASPTTALPTKPVQLTFHVVIDAKGNMTMDPKMPPAVAAP